jgi:hypothetical protein
LSTRIFGVVAGAAALGSAACQYSRSAEIVYPLIVAGLLAILWFGVFRRNRRS